MNKDKLEENLDNVQTFAKGLMSCGCLMILLPLFIALLILGFVLLSSLWR